MIDWKALHFDRRGLVAAVVQDHRTQRVLMLGYMNRRAIRETLRTGLVHFFSRSRGKLWKKGETSGHFQHVRKIQIDCDGDALLIFAQQTGAACHEGYYSCFFRTRGKDGRWRVSEKRRVNMKSP